MKIFNLIQTALAQTSGKVQTEFGEVRNVADYVNLILAWAIPIVGGLALLMTIYAGYLYMTSQGSPDQTNKAKEIMIGVITGIVLLFTIQIILNQVYK